MLTLMFLTLLWNLLRAVLGLVFMAPDWVASGLWSSLLKPWLYFLVLAVALLAPCSVLASEEALNPPALLAATPVGRAPGEAALYLGQCEEQQPASVRGSTARGAFCSIAAHQILRPR